MNIPVAAEFIDLPAASLGTRRRLPVYRYGQPGARPKAYLQTGLHADETPGRLVLLRLRALLDAASFEGRIRGEILLLPTANPIGLDNDIGGRLVGRFALNGEGNFNRGWPQLADALAQSDAVVRGLTDDAQRNVALIRAEALKMAADLPSDTEVKALKKVLFNLATDADIALDLHCDERADLHIYLGTPLWPQARDLSGRLGATATLLETCSGGEPFDEAVGGIWWTLAERFPGKPIPPACLSATVELRGEHAVDDDLALRDAEALYQFLAGRGVLTGDVQAAPPPPNEATALNAVDMPRAPCPGVIAWQVTPGAVVRRGDVIAKIANPHSDDPRARTEVLANQDGVVFATTHFPMVRLGQILCKIAGEQPLPDRASGRLLTD